MTEQDNTVIFRVSEDKLNAFDLEGRFLGSILLTNWLIDISSYPTLEQIHQILARREELKEGSHKDIALQHAIDLDNAFAAGIHPNNIFAELHKETKMTERIRCLSELPSRIRAMNKMYELPVAELPSLDEYGLARLDNFLCILRKEVEEGDVIAEEFINPTMSDIDHLVNLSDWFADMLVYIYSEATRCGIPLAEVLHIVMDSNESKLSPEGFPIKDERGKFLKGPNYWKPEPKIRELLMKKLELESKNQDLPLGS